VPTAAVAGPVFSMSIAGCSTRTRWSSVEVTGLSSGSLPVAVATLRIGFSSPILWSAGICLAHVNIHVSPGSRRSSALPPRFSVGPLTGAHRSSVTVTSCSGVSPAFVTANVNVTVSPG
jgi:hypothetical protein